MKFPLPFSLIGVVALGALAWSTGQASACSIETPDLSERLAGSSAPAFEMVDARSEEPVRRYVRSAADGSMLVLEQKHCEIENLSIVMMSPDSAPSPANAEAMAAALQATETWGKWFGRADPAAALGEAMAQDAFKQAVDQSTTVSIGADDAFSAQGESSEAVIAFTPLEDMGPFRSITSLTLSVGGM